MNLPKQHIRPANFAARMAFASLVVLVSGLAVSCIRQPRAVDEKRAETHQPKDTVGGIPIKGYVVLPTDKPIELYAYIGTYSPDHFEGTAPLRDMASHKLTIQEAVDTTKGREGWMILFVNIEGADGKTRTIVKELGESDRDLYTLVLYLKLKTQGQYALNGREMEDLLIGLAGRQSNFSKTLPPPLGTPNPRKL